MTLRITQVLKYFSDAQYRLKSFFRWKAKQFQKTILRPKCEWKKHGRRVMRGQNFARVITSEGNRTEQSLNDEIWGTTGRLILL